MEGSVSVLSSAETIRLIRDGRMEIGEEGASVSSRTQKPYGLLGTGEWKGASVSLVLF